MQCTCRQPKERPRLLLSSDTIGNFAIPALQISMVEQQVAVQHLEKKVECLNHELTDSMDCLKRVSAVALIPLHLTLGLLYFIFVTP
ncbi:hypothetical protein PISMIDRAFT_669855 [Pisolithus microcarpus 441]|uniref:Unplaced genomic scaffold scaffold_1, whole genome shotgun sequence n=1 Tax=Pisolithus microcarpus 441 TaxID=765257 RepID=A0A0C9Z0E5_9AGAM|nr:hypothetical protein PISMIDRAFT_669855 [Pisolithus microcarpus 441]